MLRVGLTGGIGSGKSTVAGIFGVIGVPVAFADAEAKRLMNEDAGLREAIIRQFGAEAYPHGTLDRKYLANKVFADPAKLQLLNSLVHPVTIREGRRWMLGQGRPSSLCHTRSRTSLRKRCRGRTRFYYRRICPTVIAYPPGHGTRYRQPGRSYPANEQPDRRRHQDAAVRRRYPQ